MPKNLHKVQKKLSKKRGKLDSMHEKSRDAKLLRRAGAREDRLARVATSAAIARQSFCQYARLNGATMDREYHLRGGMPG
jgi:translation machinery-associated protein 16